MDIAIRRIACALLQAIVLTAAASSSPLGASKTFADSPAAIPIGESQTGIETDTQRAGSLPYAPSDIGPLAQATGATDSERGVTPGRTGTENATVSALKALSEQVRSLESRIAAQDARIALLERSLDELQRRANR